MLARSIKTRQVSALNRVTLSAGRSRVSKAILVSGLVLVVLMGKEVFLKINVVLSSVIKISYNQLLN